MKIIAICGSLRFMKDLMRVAEAMELKGNCVLQVIYPVSKTKDEYTEQENELLDRMHKEKIKLADAILVVDIDGYIGNSTRSEIEFAESLGKEVIYYSKMREELEK